MASLLLLQRATKLAQVLCAGMDSLEVCCLCRQAPKFDGHHIYPRHLGGPEAGPTIPLCANHHRDLHLVSNALIAGRLPASYPFDEQQPWAMLAFAKLCEMIIDCKLLSEGNSAPLQPRKVQLELPHALLVRAHLRKADLGFTNLPAYIIQLIQRDTAGL